MADQDQYPVPDLGVDKQLFQLVPPGIQKLYKMARKELRSNARAKFKATHGITKPTPQAESD